MYICKVCKKKQRLFNRAKRTKSAKHWEQYKSFKRDTLKAIRKHRWSYINNVLQLGLDQGDQALLEICKGPETG